MTTRTNQRAQACDACGGRVEPGRGALFYRSDEDDRAATLASGWLVVHIDHDLCRQLAAERRAADEVAEARRAARRAEEARQIEAEIEAAAAFRARVVADAAAAGLVLAGYNWDRSVLVERWADHPTEPCWRRVASAPDNIGAQVLYSATSAVTGGPALIHAFGNAIVLHADAETVTEAYRRLQVRLGTTPEAARDWLSRYPGCAGHEYYTAVAAGDDVMEALR